MTATAPAPDASSRPSPVVAPPDGCLWPEVQRDELIRALARSARLPRIAAPERISIAYADLAPELSGRLRREAPFFLRLAPSLAETAEVAASGRLLAIIACDGARARLLARDGAVHEYGLPELAAFVRAPIERSAMPGLDRLLKDARLPSARAAVVRAAMIGGAATGDVVDGFRLRPPSGTLAAVFRREGGRWWLALAALSQAAQLALLMLAWWMVGTQAVAVRPGATGLLTGLLAWGGALAAFVGVRALSSWLAGRLAIEGGRLFRERLLEGLLALDAEPLRAEGVGQLLGRVMETAAVETLALGGGLQALAAGFELATGAVVLALGARGPGQLAVLLGWLALAGALAARLVRSLRTWSGLRLALTHDLVERMVGQRTLVAQQPPEQRQREEVHELDAYQRAGRALDRDTAAQAVLVPRGWLLVGTLALLPALRDSGVAAGAIATSLGGVLFVYGALRRLGQAFPNLALAAASWRRARPLFVGAPDIATDDVGRPSSAPNQAAPLVAATDLVFRYPGRAEPALQGCSLEIHRGDRVLLEGQSGGGKSTLAALITGLATPESGRLSLDGVPQAVLGLARWRARAGLVPQFHENHVFSATLAFNLLMGRAWPPRPEDLREAEALCAELGLGALLARMPSGLEQLVGETGWQLSHGERARVFIARALLQRLDLRVLDESFAALDPETLERVLPCVLARAETLVVVAHP